MNRDLPLIPTIIFLASLTLCFGIYMHQLTAFSVPVVSQIYKQFGDVNILFKNQIINLEQESKNISLQQYDIDHHVGQLGVGTDNSLFINTAEHSISTPQQWLSSAGVKAQKHIEGASTLLKCTNGLRCEPWGDPVLQFKLAWSMTDLGNNKFIVNDTVRQQIHLVNEQGGLLHTLKGFDFPNHVFKHDSNYWVVNTDTHGFIELELGNEVKKTGKEIFLSAYTGIPDDYQFPSIAYSHSDGSIFTLVHPEGMNKGRVYRLKNGLAKQLFANLEDISTFLLSGNDLYAADYKTMSIWHQDMTTGNSKQLESNSFNNAIEVNKTLIKEERQRFLLLAAFILGLGLIALVYSVKKSTPAKDPKIKTFLKDAKPIETGGEIHWVAVDARREKMIHLLKKSIKPLCIIGSILLLLGVAEGMATDFDLANSPLLINLLFCAALAVLSIGGIFAELKWHGLRSVGWDGKHLHLKGRGKTVKSLPKKVYYSDHQIYSKDISVPFQDPHRRFFDKQSFETLITPVLLPDNKLSPGQLLKLRFTDGGSEVKRELMMIIGAVVVGGIILLVK